MLKFISNHPVYPAEFDLAEFAFGNHEMPGKRAKFKGRYKFIVELFPVLKASLSMAPKTTIDTTRQTLRTFFALFDSDENFTNVECLADLDDTHGALQMRSGISASVTSCFLLYVNLAREQIGLPRLYWPMKRNSWNPKASPSEEAIRQIYFGLKHRVTEILYRWNESDALAECGRNLLKAASSDVVFYKDVTPADIHTTYRLLVEANSVGFPTIEDFRDSTGYQISVEEFSSAVFGYVPSKSDAQAFFHLLLLRTGWNVATAINIDVTAIDEIIVPHPTATATHEILYSVKSRGNTSQAAISLKKTSTSPANLVRSITARTLRIREKLIKELEQHKKLGIAPVGTIYLAELTRKISSPWIGLGKINYSDSICLDGVTFRNSTGSNRNYLQSLIDELNSRRGSSEKIPDVTPREFRDAYVSFSYKISGYNWLVAMMAAGHSNMSSLRNYLRRMRWLNNSKMKIYKFQNIFWQEVSERRIIEPAFLKILMENGEISEEQRVRWLAYKDRTRVGMGCKNIKSPPASIAPAHKKGTPCGIQRCTLCDLGMVFSDSLPGLAKRYEEILHIKECIPFASWVISSFADEEEATYNTLYNNFNPADIAAERAFWYEAIQNGTHLVPELGRLYGK